MDNSLKRPREPEEKTNPESLARSISPPARKAKKMALRMSSPFQLTRIKDLPDASNKDTVTLKDILGDPLIRECWEFNYLHDIPFLMSHFDEDIRDNVKVHVVHGFWKRDDPNLAALQEGAAPFKNVKLVTAPMPTMFGTHHTKMMILFRRDDTAQVVIHTANMIAKDWTNMTNAVWRSPLLPQLPKAPLSMSMMNNFEDAKGLLNQNPAFGSGKRFKLDLLSYLDFYNSRKVIVQMLQVQLISYDFSSIRAVFIGSVPGKHLVDDSPEPRWGWPSLKQALGQVPVQTKGKADVVLQVSSIATLGGKDNWLRNCLLESLAAAPNASKDNKPNFKIVFPTSDEIRRSLDGYSSGGSVHTKIQSAQQAKQLEYMRPYFHHWANDVSTGKDLPPDQEVKDALRKRAAPHIKTYVRWGEESIDWALLTSANISKQAWGEAIDASLNVKVASWEAGVLVWPSLLAGQEKAKMIGTFGTDELPSASEAEDDGGDETLIALRIPYSVPLQPYGNDEVPWVATLTHLEPDWMGMKWEGW